MANQVNGVIATQAVVFRGTSVVTVRGTSILSMQSIRALGGAVYQVKVAGGVSGSFGVHVLGYVGGTTYVLAGVTGIAAAGNFIMYPVGYSSTGTPGLIGDVQTSIAAINRIDQIVPPSHVVFQSGTGLTAGISANCTVGACLFSHAT